MSVKTHPLSVTHLVFGLIFLSIAGSWALRQAGLIGLDDLGWLFPLTLVVAGGVGLVAAMAKGVLGRSTPAPYEPERLEPARDEHLLLFLGEADERQVHRNLGHRLLGCR